MREMFDVPALREFAALPCVGKSRAGVESKGRRRKRIPTCTLSCDCGGCEYRVPTPRGSACSGVAVMRVSPVGCVAEHETADQQQANGQKRVGDAEGHGFASCVACKANNMSACACGLDAMTSLTPLPSASVRHLPLPNDHSQVTLRAMRLCKGAVVAALAPRRVQAHFLCAAKTDCFTKLPDLCTCRVMRSGIKRCDLLRARRAAQGRLSTAKQ